MSEITCKGSYMLGTACGKCSRCVNGLALMEAEKIKPKLSDKQQQEVNEVLYRADIERLKTRINQFNKVFRAICTELDITYGGVDVDSGEIVG